MKKLLFALVAIVLAVPAFASDCREYGIPGQDKWFKTVEQACRAWGDYLNTNYPGQGYGYRSHEGFHCLAWSSGTYQAVSERDCSENKCAKNKGVRSIPLVPWGELKFTDLSKGLYTFKEVLPPATVCEGGCIKALSSPVQMHDEHDSFIGDVKGQSYDALMFSRFVYYGTGEQCTPDGADEPINDSEKKPDEEVIDKDQCESKGGYYGQVNGKNVCLGLESEDKNKCEAEGGYYGEINGKKVCLGVDKEDKCLPGQTYGQINGKEVCLTPEGDALPKPKKSGSGNGTGPGSGGGTGGGNGTGNGTGNGNGNGQGSGGGGGGGGSGNGKGDGEGDGEGDGAGPGFGDQPGLYEPRYKNGIKGVWDQKKGQLQNTKLVQLSKRLMPTVNSGTCPKFQIDMNWGKGMNFGLLNLAPPCTIWPILRAIVMVCALILAHRIVFRG